MRDTAGREGATGGEGAPGGEGGREGPGRGGRGSRGRGAAPPGEDEARCGQDVCGTRWGPWAGRERDRVGREGVGGAGGGSRAMEAAVGAAGGGGYPLGGQSQSATQLPAVPSRFTTQAFPARPLPGPPDTLLA